MNIGMFTDSWLPARDGIVTSIIKYRGALEALGHEVFIFAPGKRDTIDPKDDHVFLFKGRPFKQYRPDEPRIPHQIPSPMLSRLLHQAIQPFPAASAKPLRRS